MTAGCANVRSTTNSWGAALTCAAQQILEALRTALKYVCAAQQVIEALHLNAQHNKKLGRCVDAQQEGGAALKNTAQQQEDAGASQKKSALGHSAAALLPDITARWTLSSLTLVVDTVDTVDMVELRAVSKRLALLSLALLWLFISVLNASRNRRSSCGVSDIRYNWVTITL